LFIGVALCVVLLAVVVPWIQASREAARRVQCSDNLKNISLALQNYEAVYRMFPMGAMHSGLHWGPDPLLPAPTTASLGPSWWYGIMDFVEERGTNKIAATQDPGGPAKHRFCADDMNAAGVPLNRFVMKYMHCPSSSLPVMETPTGPISLPSYVGIAGACDIDPKSQDYGVSGDTFPGLVAPTIWRAAHHNTHKGTGAVAGGIVTSSGILPPCQHVTVKDCVDGTADTMIVAEQSDWLLDQNPASAKKYHGDPGWSTGGTGPGGGWLSGTTRVDPVPQVTVPGRWPAVWGADCWNITTVRYPPNFKRVMGAQPLPGCSENHGINNPLQSPHPGGLLIGMVDGSVRFWSQATELAVLLRLAIRNDGPLYIPD
jgi:hypothetical protein